MTREEIIEQLDAIVGTYEILIGNGVNSDILDVDDIEAIREAISALSENKGEWIPVSERLPKAFETVLRTRVENGWNGTTYTIVDIGCICPADHNIVAWMPLPDYYKGEVEHE